MYFSKLFYGKAKNAWGRVKQSRKKLFKATAVRERGQKLVRAPFCCRAFKSWGGENSRTSVLAHWHNPSKRKGSGIFITGSYLIAWSKETTEVLAFYPPIETER